MAPGIDVGERAPRRAGPTTAPVTFADGHDGPAGGPDPGRTRDLVIGVAVLVALAAFAAAVVRVVASDDPGSASPTRLDATTPADDFDRVDDRRDVGAPSEGSWRVEGGIWGVQDQQLALTGLELDGSPNVLLWDLGSPTGTVGADFSVVRAGTGLVFRWTSADDHWEVVPAPALATWLVRRIVDGQTVVNENVGLVGVADGTQVLVRVDETTASVQVGDATPTVVDLGGPSSASLVGFEGGGLVAREARWDDFVAEPS